MIRDYRDELGRGRLERTPFEPVSLTTARCLRLRHDKLSYARKKLSNSVTPVFLIRIRFGRATDGRCGSECHARVYAVFHVIESPQPADRLSTGLGRRVRDETCERSNGDRTRCRRTIGTGAGGRAFDRGAFTRSAARPSTLHVGRRGE